MKIRAATMQSSSKLVYGYIDVYPYNRINHRMGVAVWRNAVCPQVDLADSTMSLLKSLAEPFVDKTPEDVILRACAALKGVQGKMTVPGAPKEFLGAVPNLAHTKVLSAELNGKPIPSANWNSILDTLIRAASKRVDSPKKLRSLIVVNCVEGKKEDQGYRYISEAALSVQGQDSNGAWKAIAHLAGAVGIGVDVVFLWLDNPKAASPGETGHLFVKKA